MRYVLVGNEAAAEAGNKAASLVTLADCGQAVPAWFAVHPRAFVHSLNADQRKQLVRLAKKFRAGSFSAIDKNSVQNLLAGISLIAEVKEEVARALAGFPATHFAVRSSAQEEDGAAHSFAGQFDTYLCVPKSEVVNRIVDVWKSGFSERVLSYKEQAGGVPLLPSVPAVIIQQMIDADVSGVAFSADPISGDQNRCLIEAVPGLGEGLVSGALDADRWIVNRSGRISESHIAEKPAKMVRDPRSGSGTRFCKIEHDRLSPCLTEDQIQKIAQAARNIARQKECHQDVEWCIADGHLYLLQARPITTITSQLDAASNDPQHPSTHLPEDGSLLCFDNSNIQESYPGITTPLTFSFARNAYEHVYRQFLKIMGVGPREVEAHSNVFPRMLALVQGRMYYNLASWFELLVLLPGFGANRGHMETMMGLKEPVPESIRTPDYKVGKLGMLWTCLSMLVNFLLLKRTAGRFEERVERSLSISNEALASMSLSQLSGHYRELERRLLTKWDAPLVNDFFAMIFYGMLAKLCKKWLPESSGSLENLLVCEAGGIISAEPARRIVEMARIAARSDQFVVCLCVGDQKTIEQAIAQNLDFKRLYDEYLDKFADRCLEELKLETTTLADDSLLLLRSIGQVARTELARAKQSAAANSEFPQADSCQGVPESNSDFLPESACQKVEEANPEFLRNGICEQVLPGNPEFLRNGICEKVREATIRPDRGLPARLDVEAALPAHKRLVFSWIVKQTRDLIRRRENLRFVRTLVFGRVRRIFVELGKRLTRLGVLQHERDIFYLEVEEVLKFLEGGSSCHDLGGIAAARKKQFMGWAALPEPPGRILTTTRDWVLQTALQKLPANAQPETPDTGDIKGTACSPGVVRGRVRIVTDPRDARIQTGEILVAKRTDPGWVMLFPVAAGLIVENGSLLSHSAIVSRELRLPSIVGVRNATTSLTDGELIEMDGSTGTIKRLPDEPSGRLAG